MHFRDGSWFRVRSLVVEGTYTFVKASLTPEERQAHEDLMLDAEMERWAQESHAYRERQAAKMAVCPTCGKSARGKVEEAEHAGLRLLSCGNCAR
jgi:formate dehydrogenase maturation protein FdhE